jgi:hypothetical protein
MRNIKPSLLRFRNEEKNVVLIQEPAQDAYAPCPRVSRLPRGQGFSAASPAFLIFYHGFETVSRFFFKNFTFFFKNA